MLDSVDPLASSYLFLNFFAGIHCNYGEREREERPQGAPTRPPCSRVTGRGGGVGGARPSVWTSSMAEEAAGFTWWWRDTAARSG